MADSTSGKVEETLREIGKKIDSLIQEAKEAKDDIRDDIEKKIEELKNKKEEIEEEFKTYRQSEKWKEAKDHLTSALSELKQALDTVFKK